MATWRSVASGYGVLAMIPALPFERRQQLIDAAWGALVVALTVVIAAVALWLLAATVVGSVVLARWVEGV